MADEQYIAARIAAHAADKGRVLVTNPDTGRTDILTDQVFGILRRADRFATIAGHVKKLFDSGWEDDRSGFVESACRKLVSRGLLVPKSAVLADIFKERAAEDSPPPITSFIFPTRDRISQLQRCLDGFLENIRKHGRELDYLVIDDSRDTAQAPAVKNALAPFVAGGAKVLYAGLKEKAAFGRELVRMASADGLPEDVVAFCLFGDDSLRQSYGTNRNALLMAAAGELLVMTDDDTVCRPVVPGGDGEALDLTSLNDPTLFRYYGDRAELLAAVRDADIDIISSHEKLLGRSVAGCGSSLGPGCALEMGLLGPESVQKVRKSSIVRATMVGFWGDSGMGSPNAALELLGESRDIVMRSKEDYDRATTSREVFRSVSRYTVSDGSLFMTTNAGLDNRTLLPPFLPVGRNEDGLFALTLHACAKDALIGHLPVALHHAPAEARRFPPGAFLDPSPRLAEILAAVMGSFTPSPGQRDMAERLSAMGKLFADVGSLEMRDFEEQLRTILTAHASHHIGFLEYLLDLHHGEPSFWAEDVRAMIEKFKDFILRGCPPVPRELLHVRPIEQAEESCRRLVRRFGELLLWWPVIYDAAGRLRGEGNRLVRPI